MNQQEYLENKMVNAFINWVQPKVFGTDQFHHQYKNRKTGEDWSCHSIYNAHENYEWNFSCTLPDLGDVKGRSYYESKNTLDTLKKGLKNALETKQSKALLSYCLAVLKWGGVKRGNMEKLEAMGEEITPYFEKAIRILDPKTIEIKDGNENKVNFEGIIMNAGFTKIYSLLIEDFIIYDSRVGAALGLLVRKFLEENKIDVIPDVLKFAYGKERPTKQDLNKKSRRNPSSDKYQFPVLRNDSIHHIKHNTYANWLLKQLVKDYNEEKVNLRVIESALFMIGYSVNG